MSFAIVGQVNAGEDGRQLARREVWCQLEYVSMFKNSFLIVLLY